VSVGRALIALAIVIAVVLATVMSRRPAGVGQELDARAPLANEDGGTALADAQVPGAAPSREALHAPRLPNDAPRLMDEVAP